MRYLVAATLILSSACNSAPKNSCVANGSSVLSSGENPSTCTGLCVDGGSQGLYCVSDCTDGGAAICGDSGETVCTSGEPWSPKSFCLPTCAALAAFDASCPSPLACNDAGVCAP